MLVAVRPAPQGLPGLHLLYRTRPPLCAGCVEDALRALWGPRLHAMRSTRDRRQVVRLVVPGEVELRLGRRDGEVELRHRISATPETRERTRDAFERTIRTLLVGTDSSGARAPCVHALAA